MKKFMISLMTASTLLLFIPTPLKAETETSTAIETVNNTTETAESNAKLARLEEIGAMDMSTMSRSEKKELQQEVVVIRQDRNRHHRGNYDGRRHHQVTYVSVGGGILIIILLIILF